LRQKHFLASEKQSLLLKHMFPALLWRSICFCDKCFLGWRHANGFFSLRDDPSCCAKKNLILKPLQNATSSFFKTKQKWIK
jgi:hypothetical protein